MLSEIDRDQSAALFFLWLEILCGVGCFVVGRCSRVSGGVAVDGSGGSRAEL